jgi:perosamine synthetase
MSKFQGNELRYVEEVLSSDMKSATGGTWTERLEKGFAKTFNSKYGIAHNSGTSALHTCLLAAGVQPGDEVISPGLTVIMDTFATLYVQAVPVYADINPETFTIDPESIRQSVTEKTKAIIVVHLYGLPADMNPIMEIAEEHGLIVIEDSAQCVLGRYKGDLAGSVGNMSCFSFENSKHISVGEGGMVLTDDEELAERVRKYAGIGFRNLTASSGRVRANDNIFQSPDYLRHDTLGYNFRLPELNSAVALAQLERLPQIVGLRQRCGMRYIEALAGCDWLVPQKIPEGYTNTYWTFAMTYEGVFGMKWQDFRRQYIQNGGDGFYGCWQVPYDEPVMRNYKYRGTCPVASRIQKKMMQLKTNYQDVHVATQKAEALQRTIKELNDKRNFQCAR